MKAGVMEPGTDVSFPGRYLSVTSFRQDGTRVATPVWFVEHEGRLFVETDSASCKVKRIRRNPVVSVAACTASGRLKREQVTARARVLGPVAPEPVRELMARKYRVDRLLVLPIYRVIQAARRRGGRHGDPVIVEITPTS